MTPAQRRHAREQRALLVLRRAAVRYTNAIDGSATVAAVFGGGLPGDHEARRLAADSVAVASVELTAAAQRYTAGLTGSERRRMGRKL